MIRWGITMILTNPFVENQTPRFAVETILRRHGVLRVLLAMSASVLTGSHRPLPDANNLPDHLRRDVGLEMRHERRRMPELVR